MCQRTGFRSAIALPFFLAKILSGGARPLGPGFGGQTAPRIRRADQARQAAAYCCGLYQLAKPFCRSAAAASGVWVPLITLAAAAQVAFSRFGVPRDRIW